MTVPLCSIGGCPKHASKRGWCDMHYQRWRKHGDPHTTTKRGGKPPTVFPNDQFGRLTVLDQNGLARGKERAYLCRCECGELTTVPGYALRSGNTKSCGCLRLERLVAVKTHGQCVSGEQAGSTYMTWRGMLKRCAANSSHREWYADRGIMVTDAWRGRHGFEQFLADMGERPEGKSIDRINVNGNYEPSNCRWATPSEQARNKRPRARLSQVETLMSDTAFAKPE